MSSEATVEVKTFNKKYRVDVEGVSERGSYAHTNRVDTLEEVREFANTCCDNLAGHGYTTATIKIWDTTKPVIESAPGKTITKSL